MTLNELNAHLELIEKLIKAQELLDSFWSKAHPGGQVLTGMPHSPGIKDRVGDLAAEIADMEDRIEYLKWEIAESEKPILVFIRGIDEDQTRMIFRLRFIRGLSWKEVSGTIGRWSTESSVKKECYRYLELHGDA